MTRSKTTRSGSARGEAKPSRRSATPKSASPNPHRGSTLRSLFEELGEWSEVEALTKRKVLLHNVAQSAAPEYRLWVEILLRDDETARLTPRKARARLRACGFPRRVVESYLTARESSPWSRKRRDVLCNLCGFSCLLGKGTPAEENGGLVDASAIGGYGSTPGVCESGALDDDYSYSFSLCEHCLDWLFSRFRIPVRVADRDGDERPWVCAAERVEADEWRAKKEVFRAEQARRDAARRGVYARRGLRYSLRLLREALGKTQVEIAEASGLGPEYIERVEAVPASAATDLREVGRYVEALDGRLRVLAEINGHGYELALGGDETP